MRKDNPVYRFLIKYFDSSLDLRVQSFNLLACGGIAAGVVVAASSALTGLDALHVCVNLAASALAAFLLIFARRTGRYQFCYVFTVVTIFYIAFPILFFTGGGYRSGMPSFFVFAIIFTALMLEGRAKAAVVAGEFALYAACGLTAYFVPETVTPFPTELDYAIDVFVGIFAAGLILLAVILLYIRIYNNRQKRLVELDKLKTEFYQDMHHEMKSPLNVIISYVNNADDMLDYDIDKSLIREKLEGAQYEIIRLARMLENSIDLASAEVARHHREPLDLSDILRKGAGIFRSLLEREGNVLSLDIPDGLPTTTGNKELLTRVVYNLMSNAGKHTKGGEVAVSLKRTGGMLEAAVRDTGEGIAPEALSSVWERGVSSDGTGYGLSISKTIVEEIHGGELRIESELGKGTTVIFSLPIHNKSGTGGTR